MIAVFLCFFSGCRDLYDPDIVLRDTGSCMSRSSNTIVEYSSEIYYVFILYSSDNRLRVQTVKGVCFLQTLLRKNEDVEHGVRGSHLWPGPGGIIDVTDLIDNYPHSKWQSFAGEKNSNS